MKVFLIRSVALAVVGFESYISVPIRRPDGRFFGTLCALDPRQAAIKKPQIIGMLELFAALIGFHLDAQERLIDGETALKKDAAFYE